jgi:putative (di)nucleoside polyphosphate hydrolase
MPDPAALPYRPCVGVVLLNRDGHVFAGDRADTAGPAWQMPQGGIDPGESPRAAALRELEEETGIPPHAVEVLAETAGWHRYDLPPALIGKALRGRYRGQAQKWVAMRYLGTDDRIDLAAHHPEFTAWAWLPPAELAARIVPFKRPIYDAVLAEFAPLLAPAR